MKKCVSTFLCTVLLLSSVKAQIIQTNNIQEIKKEISDSTLVLFNIAEVLIDTETSLGTQGWRKFIRTRLDPKLHDRLTLFVFESLAPKSPEPSIPTLINELQSKGQLALAFTSRGRHEWYTSQVPNVDLITESKLRQIGIDFSKTELPKELSLLPTLFADFYHEGVIYGTNAKDKGELLQEIFEKTGYLPSKVVFVDDKVDSLIEVEKMLNCLKIPFTGYAYTRTAGAHSDFDPYVATIQLDWLITYNRILSDKEAILLKHKYSHIDINDYLEEVVNKINMHQNSYPEFLYKIVSKEDWKNSQLHRQVIKSSMDTDFIHLAKEDQIPHVAEKFWKNKDYVILKLASKQLPGRLVYEINPGGFTMYYHLYDGNIPFDAVMDATLIQK